jgi:hypothetical protein
VGFSCIHWVVQLSLQSIIRCFIVFRTLYYSKKKPHFNQSLPISLIHSSPNPRQTFQLFSFQIMPQWLWEYRLLFDILVSILLSVYPEMGLLGLMVIVLLGFWGSSILLPTVSVLIYKMQSIQGFPSCHIPSHSLSPLFYLFVWDRVILCSTSWSWTFFFQNILFHTNIIWYKGITFLSLFSK